VLAKGVHMTTFVEGTRSPDGRMLPFKKGPFFLAMELRRAVHSGLHLMARRSILGKGSLRMHPGTAHVVFHPPIDPAGFATREELMQAVRAAIASGLPEWMRT
jgi:1-acyl-sn-glycerol-3-phosphate acyltransferase